MVNNSNIFIKILATGFIGSTFLLPFNSESSVFALDLKESSFLEISAFGKTDKVDNLEDLIKDGTRFDFDLDIFKNLNLTDDQKSTITFSGFVLINQDKNSASLEKGLFLRQEVKENADGDKIGIGSVEVMLNVDGVWKNNRSVKVTQEEGIKGTLEVTDETEGISSSVNANQNISPFLGTLLTNKSANIQKPKVDVDENKGPMTMRVNGDVEFSDLLVLRTIIPTDAGVGVFAEADFSKSTFEKLKATPENTSNLSLLVFGILGVALIGKQKWLS